MRCVPNYLSAYNATSSHCVRKHLKGIRIRKTLEKVTSVTRFGDISPLWQNFTYLWQNVDSLFLIWQNDEPTLANLVHYWAIKLYNHLVTLKVTSSRCTWTMLVKMRYLKEASYEKENNGISCVRMLPISCECILIGSRK